MADQPPQLNLNGPLWYVFDDVNFDINIHTIDGQYTFHGGMGSIQCITAACDTDSVVVIKHVVTPAKASGICSCAVVLNVQKHTKESSATHNFAIQSTTTANGQFNWRWMRCSVQRHFAASTLPATGVSRGCHFGDDIKRLTSLPHELAGLKIYMYR